MGLRQTIGPLFHPVGSKGVELGSMDVTEGKEKEPLRIQSKLTMEEKGSPWKDIGRLGWGVEVQG